MATPPDDEPANRPLVLVAAVASAHGVRGAFKLKCFTAEPEGVAAYGPLHDERGRELFEVRIEGRYPGGVIARARGIDDRDAADALRGTRLYVPRSALPEPEEDEFYVEDLVGLRAVGEDGRDLGEVTAVFDFGAGESLQVLGTDGTEAVYPFTRAVVPVINLPGRRLTLVPPPEVEALYRPEPPEAAPAATASEDAP